VTINIITKFKNAFEGFVSTIDMGQERISDIEYKTVEAFPMKKSKERMKVK
jgi:hypothetical protein